MLKNHTQAHFAALRVLHLASKLSFLQLHHLLGLEHYTLKKTSQRGSLSVGVFLNQRVACQGHSKVYPFSTILMEQISITLNWLC